MRIDRTWLIAAVIAAIGINTAALLLYPPGDIYGFVRPWYRELLHHGFSRPVGNYSPPYLYILWGLTFFDGLLWQVLLIKVLSTVGAVWVTFAVSRVLGSLGKPREPALLVLLLPSVILDTSLLGQADAFWVAPCLLATAAAVQRKFVRVSAWAGLAFAVKAQSAFFAPFVIYLFWSERVPARTWFVAPAVFVMAMFPAWLAGWPAAYISSIYVDQLKWAKEGGEYFVGNGASWWTFAGYLDPKGAYEARWLGLPILVAALLTYWRLMPRPSPRNVVLAATISAAGFPFLLPLMHERFFILGDVLAVTYALAFPSRRSLSAAVYMQIASALPIAAWAFDWQKWELAAWPFTLIATFLLFRELKAENGAPSERKSAAIKVLT